MTLISTGVYQADEGKVFFKGEEQLGNVIYLGINDSIENYTEGEPLSEQDEQQEQEESTPTVEEQLQELYSKSEYFDEAIAELMMASLI